jgi:hypothetical protein
MDEPRDDRLLPANIEARVRRAYWGFVWRVLTARLQRIMQRHVLPLVRRSIPGRR